MPLDSNSQTWTYDGTEAASPFKTMLNLLANSVRDSIVTLKASFSDTMQGSANWAYNSCFDVWQRGVGPFTATGWTADRWYLAARTATTVQRITLAATDTIFQTKYVAQLLATAATNSATLVQPYASEDVAEMRGRQVVFAAKVQGLNAASAVTLSVQKSATADVASSGTWTTINSTTSTPGTAGATVYVTATIPADSTAAGVRIVVSTNNNPNGYGINIGRITFKAGTTVPVQHQRRSRTIEGEIFSCQRFYVRMTSESDQYAKFGTALVSGAGNAGRAVIPLPVFMRSAPLSNMFDFTGNASNYLLDHYGYGGPVLSSFTWAGSSPNSVSIDFTTATTGPVGQTFALQANASTNVWLGFGAELP